MRDWINDPAGQGVDRIRTHEGKAGWQSRWENLSLRITVELAKYEGVDRVFEWWQIELTNWSEECEMGYQEGVLLAEGDSAMVVSEKLAQVSQTLMSGFWRIGPTLGQAEHDLKEYDSEEVDRLRIDREDFLNSPAIGITPAQVVEAYDQVLANQLQASKIIQYDDRGRESYRLTISNPLKGGNLSDQSEEEGSAAPAVDLGNGGELPAG